MVLHLLAKSNRAASDFNKAVTVIRENSSVKHANYVNKDFSDIIHTVAIAELKSHCDMVLIFSFQQCVFPN